jgi:hypothetical protein
MSVFKGFWRETGTKVARHQKHRVQKWFSHHPTTFLFAWGTKALVWDVPAVTIRGGRNAVRSWQGKPHLAKAGAQASAEVTTTVIETTGPNGDTTIRTRTTTTERTDADVIDLSGNVIHLDNHRSGKAPRNVGAPIERGHTMDSGRAMLGGTALGRGFLGVAAELDAFMPVTYQEATSTLQLTTDANRAFVLVAGGVDEFSDAIATCGLDRRVVNGLYKAVEGAEAIAAAMLQARRRIESCYAGQLDQEASGATTVQALPVLAVIGDEAAGLIPNGTVIASQYEAFEPEPDAEAMSIMERIKLSQAGFALLGASLEDLARRMAQHGIDARVRGHIRTAADEAASTATAFQKAKRVMVALYRGQMDQEASGNGTIRTIPVHRRAS